MSESGSGKSVSTGIRIGTVNIVGEGDDRRDPIEPGGRLRHDNLLVEQFPEIPVRLEDARALAPLNSLLELENDALQSGASRSVASTCAICKRTSRAIMRAGPR